jgi:hypothetical protein
MARPRESRRRLKESIGTGSVTLMVVWINYMIVYMIVLHCWHSGKDVRYKYVQAWNHPNLSRKTARSRVCVDDGHRRDLMATCAGSLSLCWTVFGGSKKAMASESVSKSQIQAPNRPTAPTEALVPATQQRLLLEKAAGLAKLLVEECNIAAPSSSSISSSSSSSSRGVDLLDQLKEIFEPPVETPARKTAVSMTRRYKVDEQVLQRAVATKLSGATVRAAMNVYSANLRFGESYMLTATGSTKKELIRQYDGLPDVKLVISADLDLRDLYRNQVQTTIEDIQAELYRSVPDPAEVVALLAEAKKVYGSWFALISENDTREALQLAEAISSSGTEEVKLPEQKF